MVGKRCSTGTYRPTRGVLGPIGYVCCPYGVLIPGEIGLPVQYWAFHPLYLLHIGVIPVRIGLSTYAGGLQQHHIGLPGSGVPLQFATIRAFFGQYRAYSGRNRPIHVPGESLKQMDLAGAPPTIAYRARKHRLCTFKCINNTSIPLDARLAHSLSEVF